jgi:hypothetical protein
MSGLLVSSPAAHSHIVLYILKYSISAVYYSNSVILVNYFKRDSVKRCYGVKVMDRRRLSKSALQLRFKAKKAMG